MELISKDTAIRVVDSGRNRQQLVDMMRAIPPVNAIEIPEGATNGEVIKAITGEDFSRGSSIYNHDLMICEGEYYLAFNVDWWNAPYKGSEG